MVKVMNPAIWLPVRIQMYLIEIVLLGEIFNYEILTIIVVVHN